MGFAKCSLNSSVSRDIHYLDDNLFFNPKRNGFPKKISSETQRICFTHDIATAVDNRNCIDSILIDFSRAFYLSIPNYYAWT